jgi:ketosteroid isomerase-like protein
MNSDHVQIVRQLYEAFARGDVPAVLGSLDKNVHWQEAEGFVYADHNPYVGHDAVLQGVFGRLAGEWDGFSVHPKDIVATADGALAMGRYTGTYKATGKRVDAEFAHVWRIADGKVRSFQQYTDTAQFTSAVAGK